MLDEPVPGKRRGEGRQNTRPKDSSKRDKHVLGKNEDDDVLDRTTWNRDIQNFSGDAR